MCLQGVCKYRSQGHSLYTLAPAPIPRAASRAPQPGCGCIPQASSGAQRWPLSLGPWVLPFLDVYKVILRLHLTSLPRHETSLPCKRCCVSGAPASNLPTPSCSWTFFPSVPDNFLVSNYQCWADTARISASLAFCQQNKKRKLQIVSVIYIFSNLKC